MKEKEAILKICEFCGNTLNTYNRKQPSLEVLHEIAKILGVGIKDLIVENERDSL